METMAIDIKINRHGKAPKHRLAIGMAMLRQHAARKWPEREYTQSEKIEGGHMIVELTAHG